MKRLLFFAIFILIQYNANSQLLTVQDFLAVASLSPKNFNNYISRRNFVFEGRDWQNDTIVNTYSLRIKGSVIDSLHITRLIETYQTAKNFSFVFKTSSKDDLAEARKELKDENFFCSNEKEPATFFLYQRKNITVHVSIWEDTDDTLYAFHFYKKELPSIEKIHFTEDLLLFTSHEYLVSVFGEKNVKKDVYYFSEKEIVKCSVLFPYTKRQAVFIWNDEANRCGLSSILIGGNLSTESSINYKQVIAENSWMSKEGVYSGMSLTNLARLNGNDFKFYGKNAEFPFMVVPENTGKINFKRNIIVLGCLSNNSSQLLNSDTIAVNDVLQDNPGIFVFMYMLSPSKD